MRSPRIVIALFVAALFGFATRASATTITIGTFSYDPAFLFGPAFFVFNTSQLTTPGTFEDTTVEMLDGATSTPLPTALGTIIAGASADTSVDDLSLLGFFSSARVTFKFTPTSSPSTQLTAIATMTGFTSLESSPADVFITVDLPTDTTPVPEPGSMLLVGSGVVFLARRAVRRTRSRHHLPDATSRRFSP